MSNTVVWVAFCLNFFTILNARLLQDKTGNVHLEYEATDNGLNVVVKRNDEVQLQGILGVGKSLKDITCPDIGNCEVNNLEEFSISPIENGFIATWVSYELTSVEACFDLNSNTTHWYGGPEYHDQVWPLEKMTITYDEPYIIKTGDGVAVAERYWMNSKGGYLYFNESVPLWVDQNNNQIDTVCFKAEDKVPYINENYTFIIIFGGYNNSKEAHLGVANTLLGIPTGHPNEKMITEPIWTTWAKYKKSIQDSVVLDFASDIRSHGYQGGQLEIDDDWEVCYGSQVFNTDRFADINNTIQTLKKDNWRVTLWVHPFVDDNCQNNSDIGKQKGYFVKNTTGETKASWWNNDNSHQIDFTKPEAAQWWSDRLRKLQEDYGIDAFKFDAGETDYVNQPAVYEDIDLAPNILTTKYIETCSEFGNLIEARSAFRTQHLPHFVRMLDKDSSWGISNGLASLITTLLQLNMNGYGMVLPDMIGGNGYGQQPTAELLVRWTQANTFMPSMQFSYLPWDFASEASFDIEGIVKKYVQLHEEYAPKIIAAMEQSIEDGTPVNPPIWWVDPLDWTALGVADEFLLGEEILVAPVIEEGATSRDVYLPTGQWKDGNTGDVYQGPIMLDNYTAPIDILPWFTKVE